MAGRPLHFARRAALLLVAVLGCGAPAGTGGEMSASTATDTSSGGSDEGDSGATGASASAGESTGPAVAPRCTPPAGISGSPATIAQAVELINALPRPVSLDCFVQSLDRPLSLTATTSTVSLQPAVGARSPRVFLFTGPLVMSIAIEGQGAALLELGEPTEPGRSLKAEVEFPVTAELPIEAPFERTLRPGAVTTCGVCHAYEEPAVDAPAPMAFDSEALRHRDDEEVDAADLAVEWTACDADTEPDRCARLDALFSHGEVVHQPFDPSLPTIYQ